MEKREKFSISIGDRETRIILDPKELAAYRETIHPYDIPKSKDTLLIDKAVEKLFGPKSFWTGEHNNMYIGQVFKPLPGENCVNTSLTNKTFISIKQIEKEQKRDFPSYGR